MTGTEETIKRLREYANSLRWQRDHAGERGKVWLLPPYEENVHQHIADIEAGAQALEEFRDEIEGSVAI